MNLNNTLSVGERVDVVVGDERYRSGVYSIMGASQLAVYNIAGRAERVKLKRGREVKIVYLRGANAFSFPACLLETVEDGDPPYMVFSCTGESERFQQRNSFRLAIRMPLRIRCARPGRQRSDALTIMPAYSVDLSGTGLMAEIPYEIPLGNEVSLDISLDGERSFTIFAEVMHLLPPERTDGRVRAGMRFVDISPRLHNYLNRFLLNEQIKAVRKT